MDITEVRYTIGDATTPRATGPAIIGHICNDIGRWGKGFVLALSARWPEPARAYRDWYRQRGTGDFALGAVQLVQISPNLHVANMIGQHDIKAGPDGPPIRYDAVDRCLGTLAESALFLNASVHLPRIGCGLAGGTWDRIEPLLRNRLCARGVPVTVYDLG
ncbi:macro domain-containing protein [Nocardia sp. NPDC006630]|uniref:macro domain-containing protein n=1 Tax=Nocardia sp. NPDC006630 TaxID=3157181 RepID=UPI0033A7AB8A